MVFYRKPDFWGKILSHFLSVHEFHGVQSKGGLVMLSILCANSEYSSGKRTDCLGCSPLLLRCFHSLPEEVEALEMSCNIYGIIYYRIQIKKVVARRRRKRRIRSIKRIKSTRNTKSIRRRRQQQLQQPLWLQQTPPQHRESRKQRQNPKR